MQRKPRLSGLSGSPRTLATRPSSMSTSIPHSVGWQFIGHIVRTVRSAAMAPEDTGCSRRAYDADARSAGGTGLGLAIVRRLSHLLGGAVALESHVGHGSRVTVEVPRVLTVAVLTSERGGSGPRFSGLWGCPRGDLFDGPSVPG